LPVVTSFTNGTPSMTHRRYEGDEALRPNRWGLQEPIGTDAVPPDALDGIIVPAFGAGRNGHRIGHGRGYYDAFLADLGAPTIALVYDACLVDTIPAAPHDVPMSAIVTEHETFDVPVAA
jgi:5-formyltetrahydrofolate cyclo-ligase